jgi:hypothetical protein
MSLGHGVFLDRSYDFRLAASPRPQGAEKRRAGLGDFGGEVCQGKNSAIRLAG